MSNTPPEGWPPELEAANGKCKGLMETVDGSIINNYRSLSLSQRSALRLLFQSDLEPFDGLAIGDGCELLEAVRKAVLANPVLILSAQQFWEFYVETQQAERALYDELVVNLTDETLQGVFANEATSDYKAAAKEEMIKRELLPKD